MGWSLNWLKPANVKVTADGTVKVLDFGLAKLIAGEALDSAAQGFSRAAATNVPTITSPAMMTGAGTILGTAAYMSPEQARGKFVDKRTDIWAFGCVLYEMLTGRRAFEGDEITDVLARILEREPDFSVLPPTTPPAIGRLLRRSLEKDRKHRLSDAADARLENDEALAMPAPGGSTGPALRTVHAAGWRRAATLTFAVLATGIVSSTVVWLATRGSAPRVSRQTITPSSAAALAVSGFGRDLAISPDGTHVVYVGTNLSQLFVRALDQLEATPITGRGSLRSPFISPDGQWIGFFDVNTSALKKVAISGGPDATVCRIVGNPRGAFWSPDGTIIFATDDSSSGFLQVPADEGEPKVLTTPNRQRGESGHLWPEFLPGGHAVLFTITPTTDPIDNAQVAVFDLPTGTQKILVRGGSNPHYVPSGHLVYGAANTLRAVAFDLTRLEVVGTPVPVLSQVVTQNSGAADFDVALDGTLVYMPGGPQAAAAVTRTLVWVDRQGHEEPLKAPARTYVYPRLSPDGTHLALDVRDRQNDIWIWDLARETLARLTLDPATDRNPAWTPDGRRVVFTSERAGTANLFWQAADGTGPVERLTQSQYSQFASSISPDGTRLLFWENGTTRDLMMLALEKERRVQPPSQSSGEPGCSSTSKVRPLVQTPFVEENGEISPDGRWLAYDSDESGRFEIYMGPFPDVNSGHWQVSPGGGTKPLWARDRQELFHVAPSGALMSVHVDRGATWSAGWPTRLFEGPYFFGDAGNSARTYDVSPDGKRFLMIKPVGGFDQTAAPASLVVVQNWFEELKRLVPRE